VSTGNRTVAAVGVFDGLHLGHRALLERALANSRAAGVPCVVVSFDPHPDVVLARTFQPIPPLTPIPEKRERLRAMGVERLDVLPFTRELAALEPEEFVDRHLVAVHHPIALVVGEDFALGRRRAGNVSRLVEIGAARGFEVHAVPLLEIDGEAVTSTRVRALLGDGRVAAAARLLGRPYDLAGTVVMGAGVGRTLGVPTANVRLHEEKFLPGHGVYAAWTWIGSGTERVPTAMSIGTRPTFGGSTTTLEAHLLDWSGDLVGRELRVELIDWLRPQLRFDDSDALRRAMDDDLARTRVALGVAAV
jgi:riboflavin kinase/FMN adenylyltransferase